MEIEEMLDPEIKESIDDLHRNRKIGLMERLFMDEPTASSLVWAGLMSEYVQILLQNTICSSSLHQTCKELKYVQEQYDASVIKK
jgi:hypothetical protein